MSCVAAPLRGAGRAVASVSLCGNGTHRELERLAPVVLAASRAVWRSLFGPGRADAARKRTDPAPDPAPSPAPAAATPVGAAEMDNMMSWLRFADWM